MHKHTNSLIQETSPYLLQHAHNPVQWLPWSEDALAKAREENKPILVSIGYSACHWCHVMERESFEDEAIAAIMNDHFINIKIDREERPDLDHIYMDAVQAMTGSGGWPLNVFLTPDAKPFFGGTYFPPQKAYNRPSWQDTLFGVIHAFGERRHEIDAQAENLTQHLLASNSFGMQKETDDDIFTIEKSREACENIIKAADKEWGGFGRAPKFPQTFSIQYLLRYAHLHYTSGVAKEKISPVQPSSATQKNDMFETLSGGVKEKLTSSPGIGLEEALLSLDKMIGGGIYDQIGGGFARYSTDTEWLAPHFEKMLYDNALLTAVLSEAYQLTKKESYKEVIEETMDFIQREMLDKQNGFYAALDADSEGVEGKFYVWDEEQIDKILGSDAVLFKEYYDVSEVGNWEHTNILRAKKNAEQFAAAKNLNAGELKVSLKQSALLLLEHRNKRIRPQLDDKIILGWNALMNTACSKAFAATGNNSYRQLAVDNMEFLLSAFQVKGAFGLHHTWKNNQAKHPAFLDDYAFLIQALIHLQEITADTKWLVIARDLTQHVIENFGEETVLPQGGENDASFFYYTSINQADIIIRKKEVYDGAVPSGNSVMAGNLWQLSILFDNPGWREKSISMVKALSKAISRYPTSFGNWACLHQEIVAGTNEIVIIGDDFMPDFAELLAEYIPHRVFMATSQPTETFPLLAGKPCGTKTYIYLCRNYTCQNPVFSAKELILLINKGKKGN